MTCDFAGVFEGVKGKKMEHREYGGCTEGHRERQRKNAKVAEVAQKVAK